MTTPLARATPASLPESLGAGRPLPAGLRRAAEVALHAELSQLRVHDDPRAHELARRHRARAFACGVHLIFGQGELRVDTPEGRLLLLHEIVHALQQTGTPAADGRLRARPRVGAGPLQRKWIPRPKFDNDPYTITVLGRRYLRLSRRDPEIVKAVRQVAAARETGRRALKRRVWALAYRATKLANPWLATYVYDLGKTTKVYGASIRIIEHFPGVRTSSTDLAMIGAANWTWARKQVVPWARGMSKRALQAQWIFMTWLRMLPSQYSPLRLYEAIAEPLIRAFRHPVRSLGYAYDKDSGRWKAFESQASVLIDTPSVRGQVVNELYVWSIWAAYRLDLVRRRMMAAAWRHARSAPDPARRRIEMIIYLGRWLRAAAGEPQAGIKNPRAGLPRALWGLLELTLPLFRKAVRAAKLVWQPGAQVFFRGQQGKKLPGLKQTPAQLLAHLRASPKLATFREALLAAVAEATRLDAKGRVPDRVSYAAHIRRARAKLRVQIARHEAKLRPVTRQLRPASIGAWPKGVDRLAVTAHTFALLSLHELDAQLKDYSPRRDASQERRQLRVARALLAKDPAYRKLTPARRRRRLRELSEAPDYRGKHRLYVAWTAYQRAVKMQWPALARAVADVLAPQPRAGQPLAKIEADERARHLVIFGDWEARSRSLSRLPKDIGQAGPLRGIEPLTLVDVYNALVLMEYRDLDRDLGAALRKGGRYIGAKGEVRTDYAPKHDLIALLARKQRARVHPQRWVLPGDSYVFRPSAATRANFAALLLHHPKTAQLIVEEHQHERPYVLYNVGYQTPVVVWAIPDPLATVKSLQGDKILDAFVQAYRRSKSAGKPAAVTAGAKAKAAPAKPGAAKLGFRRWLALLWEALETQRKHKHKLGPDRAAATKALEAWQARLRATTRKTRLKVAAQLRRASIATRHYYVVRLLRPMIAGSGGSSRQVMYGHVSVRGFGRVRRLNVPGRALGRLYTLLGRLTPATDVDAHRAAAVAGVAGAMRSAWSTTERYSIISRWHALVLETIAALRSPKRAKPGHASLDEVQLPSERAGRGASLAALVALDSAWRAQILAIQTKFGMVGRKRGPGAPRGLLTPVRGGPSVKAGKGEASFFQIHGVGFAIERVFENFTYYRRYNPHARLRSTVGGKAHPQASRLYVDGKPIVTPKERAALTLLRYERQGMPARDIKGDDEDALDELSRGIDLHAIVVNLRTLAKVIEASLGVIVDVLELVPGVGQLVAGTRIGMAVFSFFASGQFEQLLRLVRDDPRKILGDILDRVRAILANPARLWRFFLFGRLALPGFPARTSRNRLRRRHGRGKLGRVVAKIARIGRIFGSVLRRLQRRIVATVDRLRMFVLERPRLASVIAFLAPRLRLLTRIRLADLIADPLGTARAKVEAAAAGLGRQLRAMLAKLGALRVPKQIIPMARLVEVIVDILVRRLGGKYKYAVRGFMFLLEKTGMKSKIIKALTARFAGHRTNPNTFVVGVLRKVLGGWVGSAVAKLHGLLVGTVAKRIDGLLGSTAFSAALGKTPPAISVGLSTEEFELADDTAGSAGRQRLAREPGLVPAVLPSLPSAAGRPLPAKMRASVEGSLGQDFGHVRMHTDAAAERLTRDHDALALTSGSHVYLGAQVGLGSDGGQRVLRHELTHVVQQTGPRPLGLGHSEVPAPGRPGAGLIHSPRLEAEAERVAAGGTAESGVHASSGPAVQGLQPALLDEVGGPLLTELSSSRRLRERAQTIDRTGAGEGMARLEREQARELERVWAAVSRALAGGTTLKFSPPFKHADKHIRARFTNASRARRIRNALGDLGKASQVEVKATGDNAPLHVVDPDRFEVALAEYLLARTGIGLALRLARGKRRFDLAAKPSRQWFHAREPLKSLKVVFVDLLAILGTDPLWIEAIASRWSTLPKTAKGQESKRLRLRGVLRELGVSAAIWQRRRYAFSKVVVERVKEIENRRTTPDLVEAANLPSKREYLDLDKVEARRSHNIGLRLGYYIQHKHSTGSYRLPGRTTPIKAEGQQSGLERESHHTTQFLLLDFLHNTSTPKAFPLLGQHGANLLGGKPIYPQLRVSGGEVTGFAGKFEIGKFWKDRGGLMPALLVGRVTHRRGRLHVTPKPDDIEGGRATQGATVANDFRRKLPKGYKDAEKAGATEFQRWVRRTGEPTVVGTIERAMLDTYRQMYAGHMKGALALALVQLEMPYYNDLAEAAGKSGASWRLDSGDMGKVARAAETHNVATMKKAGFQ